MDGASGEEKNGLR